jgi:hypothetical protein
MAVRPRAAALALALSFTGLLTLGSLRLAAQEPAKAGAPAPAESAPAKRVNDPTRRVPPFFGQIGLTPEQREEVYKIRGKHGVRIAELQKELARAQAEMLADCETVLSDTQKQLLETRRRASAASQEARRKSAPAATPPAQAGASGNSSS